MALYNTLIVTHLIIGITFLIKNYSKSLTHPVRCKAQQKDSSFRPAPPPPCLIKQTLMDGPIGIVMVKLKLLFLAGTALYCLEQSLDVDP